MHCLHLIFIIFLIFSVNLVTLNKHENDDVLQCSIEKESDRSASNEIYKKEYNLIFQNINKSKRKYYPCTSKLDDPTCECHADIIRKDLATFKEKGITKSMIKEAANFGTLYKIYQHKLYRDSNCMFPSRCEGVEHFIMELLPQLPNMDFVINTRDYPQVHAKFGSKMRPIFSFSKTSEYLDIMYPAWTFWAGGPAISLHPTGIGRWDIHRENISKVAETLSWDTKEAKAFFRGSRTSDERDSLILLSRRKQMLVDAQYTKNQAWKSSKDTLNAEPAKEVSFEDHCRYKYLFNFRGVAASFRFKHLFLCRSLVFHVGDEWIEFYYPAMKPWVHYVPLEKYPTEKDIEVILEFFKEHDDLARDIAEKGYEFIWNHLRMQDIECYWRKLLKNYGKLIKYKIEEDERLIEIKEKVRKY